MQILGLWVFFVFISSPISTLFTVLEKQKMGLFINIIRIVLRAASLIVGGLLGSARIGLFLFSGTGVIVSAWLCFCLLSYSGVPITQAINYFAKHIILYCLPMIAPIFLAKWAFELSSFAIVIIACCSALLYYAIILKQDTIFREHIKMVL